MSDHTENQLTSLDEVSAYRHPGVVGRYAKDHGASREEAEEVFREMLKWLYLCYRNATDFPDAQPVAMFPELMKLDWMWHTFILFTRDYSTFCTDHFGYFLHHSPEVEDGNEAAPEEAEIRGRLERQFALVHDILGEETLRVWHDECRYAAES
jgi:hypothetical protein